MNRQLLLPASILIFIILLASCAPNGETDQSAEDETPQIEESQPGGTAIPDSTGQEAGDESTAGTADQGAPAGTPGESGDEGAGAELPEEWPDDIPIFSGLTVRTGQKAGENGYMLGMVGEAALEDVLGFYNALEGWEFTGENDSYSEGVAKIYTRGDEELEVYVRNTPDGVMVRLTYYDRTQG
jgi:hypothetical protein